MIKFISIYYLVYLLQLNYFFIGIALFLLYYLLIIQRNLNLVHIFLVVIPSIYNIDLSFFNIDKLLPGIYFLTFIDPIFIASIFCFLRNILNFKNLNFKRLFIIYLFIVFFNLIHLIIYSGDVDINTQGFAYGIKSLLYVNALFLVNSSSINKLKKEFQKIIQISLIIFSSVIFLGHYNFFISAFPVVYLKFRRSIFSLIIFIWTSSIILTSTTSITSIAVYILSTTAVFLNYYKLLLKNFFFIFIPMNISILLFILLYFNQNYVVDYININFDEILINQNFFMIKILLDRIPLQLATIDQFNFMNGNYNNLVLITKNIIFTDSDWGYGMHNYFFNLSFKSGFITAIFVYMIINFFFYNIHKAFKILKINNSHDNILFYEIFFIVLIIFFSVWSLTGNSFSENVGFLFFIFIGSIFSMLKNEIRLTKKNKN